MVDILKEAISLGEGGPTVLHEVECSQLSKGGEKLLYLKEKRERGREGERGDRQWMAHYMKLVRTLLGSDSNTILRTDQHKDVHVLVS